MEQVGVDSRPVDSAKELSGMNEGARQRKSVSHSVSPIPWTDEHGPTPSMTSRTDCSSISSSSTLSIHSLSASFGTTTDLAEESTLQAEFAEKTAKEMTQLISWWTSDNSVGKSCDQMPNNSLVLEDSENDDSEPGRTWALSSSRLLEEDYVNKLTIQLLLPDMLPPVLPGCSTATNDLISEALKLPRLRANNASASCLSLPFFPTTHDQPASLNSKFEHSSIENSPIYPSLTEKRTPLNHLTPVKSQDSLPSCVALTPSGSSCGQSQATVTTEACSLAFEHENDDDTVYLDDLSLQCPILDPPFEGESSPEALHFIALQQKAQVDHICNETRQMAGCLVALKEASDNDDKEPTFRAWYDFRLQDHDKVQLPRHSKQPKNYLQFQFLNSIPSKLSRGWRIVTRNLDEKARDRIWNSVLLIMALCILQLYFYRPQSEIRTYLVFCESAMDQCLSPDGASQSLPQSVCIAKNEWLLQNYLYTVLK